MFLVVHMIKYLRQFSREELNHNDFIFEGEVEISDDESEFNEDIFFL